MLAHAAADHEQLVSLRDHLVGEADIGSKKQKSLRAKLQESINVADLLAGRWVFFVCLSVPVDFLRILFDDSGDTGAWVAGAMSHFHVNSKAKRSSLQAAQVLQFLKSGCTASFSVL